MLAQRQNLEMICNPSDYFIHVSKAGEDRKQLSMADTVGVSGRGGDSSHFLCKACIISAHNLIQGLRCVPWLYKSFNPVCIAVFYQQMLSLRLLLLNHWSPVCAFFDGFWAFRPFLVMCIFKYPLWSFNLSVVSHSVTPRTAARPTPLAFSISQSLLKLMSIESVMPSSHLILCQPLMICVPSVWPYPDRRVAVTPCSIESLSTLLFCH